MAAGWPDNQLLDRDSRSYGNVAVCFLGICIWELVHTADAAWALVARGRWRRPQLVAAALCRLWTFAAVLGAVIAEDPLDRVNCSPLSIFNAWSLNTAALLALGLLTTSAVMLTQRRSLVLPGAALLLFAAVFRYIHAFAGAGSPAWDPARGACVPAGPSPRALAFLAAFFTLGAYAFLALALLTNTLAPGPPPPGAPRAGVAFAAYAAVLLANIPPAVFVVLNLNPIMNEIATIPAAVLSAIVAARAAHATADLRAPAPDGAPVDVFAHSSVALGTGMTSSAGVGSRTAGTGSRTAGARSSLTTSRGLPSLRLTTRDLAPEPFGASKGAGSPPAFGAELEPDWMPAGAASVSRLSFDSARISPIQFARH